MFSCMQILQIKLLVLSTTWTCAKKLTEVYSNIGIHLHLFMTMNCSGLNQVDLICAYIHVCHNICRLPTVFLSWWGKAAFSLVPPFRDNELLWPESSWINSCICLISINLMPIKNIFYFPYCHFQETITAKANMPVALSVMKKSWSLFLFLHDLF